MKNFDRFFVSGSVGRVVSVSEATGMVATESCGAGGFLLCCFITHTKTRECALDCLAPSLFHRFQSIRGHYPCRSDCGVPLGEIRRGPISLNRTEPGLVSVPFRFFTTQSVPNQCPITTPFFPIHRCIHTHMYVCTYPAPALTV